MIALGWIVGNVTFGAAFTVLMAGLGQSSLAAVIAAGGSVIAAVVSGFLYRKVQEVHVLVNSQLTDVMEKLSVMTEERDRLAPERAGSEGQSTIQEEGS